MHTRGIAWAATRSSRLMRQRDRVLRRTKKPLSARGVEPMIWSMSPDVT